MRHIVFDVNETLLDLAALDPFFAALFGDPQTRSEWFFSLEESWLTATIIDRYAPFGELAQGALVMVGRRRGIDVDQAAQQELIARLKALPPHEDVVEALELLRERGFTLTALTNGTQEAARQQLQSAGLDSYFQALLSVDTIRRYKPAPEAYRMAAEHLGIEPREFLMVAAHAWDIAGAASVGCRTAFVHRPGKVLNPAGVQPDLVGDGVLGVAKQMAGSPSTEC